jgi:hypothetical protein
MRGAAVFMIRQVLCLKTPCHHEEETSASLVDDERLPFEAFMNPFFY